MEREQAGRSPDDEVKDPRPRIEPESPPSPPEAQGGSQPDLIAVEDSHKTLLGKMKERAENNPRLVYLVVLLIGLSGVATACGNLKEIASFVKWVLHREQPAAVTTERETDPNQAGQTPRMLFQATGGLPAADITWSAMSDGQQVADSYRMSPQVRPLFEQGRKNYAEGDPGQAIDALRRCLALETALQNRALIHRELGKCYSRLEQYSQAEDAFAAGARAAEQTNENDVQADNLVGRAKSIREQPALSHESKAKKIRRAFDYLVDANNIVAKSPYRRACILNELGYAYQLLPVELSLDGDEKNADTVEQKIRNINQAIQCHRTALEFFQADQYPYERSITLRGLGDALLYLPTGTASERVARIEGEPNGTGAVMDCYREAIALTDRDNWTDHASACWALEDCQMADAAAQNSLAVALLKLSELEHESAREKLLEALNCLEATLKIWTREKYPLRYAIAADNAGAVNIRLGILDRENEGAYWEKGIEYLRLAENVYERRPEYRLELALTRANLGTAYGGRRTNHRQQFVSNRRQAIEMWGASVQTLGKQVYPEYFCYLAFNLMSAYNEIGERDSARKWLEEVYPLRNYLASDDAEAIETQMARLQK